MYQRTFLVDPKRYIQTELQKRANRANQLVLFFLAGANFWEIHAKRGEKQGYFGAKFFVGKIGRC